MISHEKFISVVQHWTDWNKKIALLQGCRDQCDAYRPAILHRMLQLSDIIPPELPFVRTKRDSETTPSPCSQPNMPTTATVYEQRCANVTPPPEDTDNGTTMMQAHGQKRLKECRDDSSEGPHQRCIRRRMS
jgi:hypothetical protein